MRGVRDLLLQETGPSGGPEGLLYVAELHNKITTPKMDHLVCFLPGKCLANLGRRELVCLLPGAIFHFPVHWQSG